MGCSCYGKFSDHRLVRVDVRCPVPRSVKENKYLRKRETTFKTVFQFGRLGFSSALIKQKKIGKKFMI